MAIGRMNFFRLEWQLQKKAKNFDKEELENLADIIKQSMFHDYKIAYSEKGDAHKEEAQATLAVG